MTGMIRAGAAAAGVVLSSGAVSAQAPIIEADAAFRLDPASGVMADGGVSRGVAWGDYTGDGYPDLAVANTDGGPVFLYRNVDGARFERVVDGDVAAFRGDAQGVAFVDIDNDGRLDLFVTAENAPNRYYRNTGAGRLVEAEAGPLTATVSASTQTCWADIDGDGLLDAYVVNADHQDDLVFRNRGPAGFERVDGPWTGAGENGRSCAWGDPDGDGAPDLYVTNAYDEVDGEPRYAPNSFYRNSGGFEFVREERGEFVNAYGYSYGVSWFDHDQDGDADLFVSNIARHQPNRLYENLDGAFFMPDWSSPVMRDLPGPVKGHAWGDFDNDGDPDLFVAEGHGGARPEHAPFDNVNRYYQNDRGEHRPAFVARLTEDNRVSAGAAAADVDRDGDLDLFIANWSGDDLDNEFYRNETGGNAIIVELEGVQSNSYGVGSSAALELGSDAEGGPVRIHRSVWLNNGYASMSEPVLHFGLGDASAGSLTIRWPSGIVDVHEGVEAGRYVASEGGRLRSAGNGGD